MGILQDRAVLITGAASGIGRATALEAHAEGARLLLSDVDTEGGEGVAAEIAGQGGTAIFARCDVTSEAEVQALVARARDELGRLDGAFNCAGILGTVGLTTDTSYEAWRRILEVDLMPNQTGVLSGPMCAGDGSNFCARVKQLARQVSAEKSARPRDEDPFVAPRRLGIGDGNESG